MLSGSENGFVYVWDMVEGGMVAKLNHDEGATEALPSTLAVHSLAAHPSKVALLTAAKTREENGGCGSSTRLAGRGKN